MPFPPRARIVLAGGSGFVGRALVRACREAGYEPVVLSRRGPDETRWDARTLGPWSKALDGASALINLTGETVAQRWTPAVRRAILESRVESARVLHEAVAGCDTPPSVWVNASAVGYYGNRGPESLTEESAHGPSDDFLVRTCLEWERSFFDRGSLPRVCVRIGFVLGRDGGGFPLLVKLARAFLGGAVGSGRQGMSWIHVDDLARLFLFIAERHANSPPIAHGAYNGTSPEPVSNADFMGALRAELNRPWVPPVPAFALRAASAFGLPEPEIILHGQFAHPARAIREGFEFAYPSLRSAIRALL